MVHHHAHLDQMERLVPLVLLLDQIVQLEPIVYRETLFVVNDRQELLALLGHQLVPLVLQDRLALQEILPVQRVLPVK